MAGGPALDGATPTSPPRRRNHGGVLFFDVRDSSGLVQATVAAGAEPAAAAAAERLRIEYVVAVSGVLRRRQDPNPAIHTGASLINLRTRNENDRG